MGFTHFIRGESDCFEVPSRKLLIPQDAPQLQ